MTWPWAKRAPMRLHLAGVFALRRRQRHAAGHQHARQIAQPASAIIIAGSPLSHVATPSTPARVGSERISRRKTIAASLRYGRLSIMPVVPCVRPSHGSVQEPANGMQPRRLELLRRRLHQQADFPVAGVIAERDRRAVVGAQAAVRAEDQKLRLAQ